MRVTVLRIANRDTYCISRLYIDGERFCDVLEDVDRGLDDSMSEEEILKKKVKGKTAIPTGVYPLKITYSPKCKRMMPLVENVKGYSGIRLHSGNRPEDTEGCLLVGENKVVGQVINSRATYNKLFKILSETKERIIIEIRRK